MAEATGDLDTYLKSRGINPKFVGTDSKIAHSKSGEFAKWKRDHKFEEVQVEQIATSKHTPTEIKQHELLKKIHKHQEIGAVKAEAWDQPDYNQSIKARQAEADKKNKEQSKEGVNKLLTTYRAKNKKEHHVTEEVDKKDTVTMDIPFLIRVLELAREDVKDDADLHRVVEKLIDIRDKGTLTMDDYDFVAKLKEEVEQISELNKNTLTSYITKSTTDIKRRKHDIDVAHGRAERSKRPEAKSGWENYKSELLNKNKSRASNIGKAAHKLATEEVLDEGKMGQLSADIGQHIDKHVDEYKSSGGAEHLMSKIDHTAKKIAAQHGLEHKHAHKFVSDYVEKKLHEEILDEVSDQTLDKAWHGRYQQALAAKHGSPEHQKAHKSMGKINDVMKKRISGKLMHMAKHDPEAYKKSAQQVADDNTKRGWSNEEVQYNTEDVFQDSQAATQTSFDGANSPDDTVQNRKRQLSKSARIIRSIYKRKKMTEDTYDWEKEDKSVTSYGKKPKMTMNDNDGGEPEAVAVLSGGKTLTGEPRDTVEIDPMMKSRSNQQEVDLDKKKDKQ